MKTQSVSVKCEKTVDFVTSCIELEASVHVHCARRSGWKLDFRWHPYSWFCCWFPTQISPSPAVYRGQSSKLCEKCVQTIVRGNSGRSIMYFHFCIINYIVQWWFHVYLARRRLHRSYASFILIPFFIIIFGFLNSRYIDCSISRTSFSFVKYVSYIF